MNTLSAAQSLLQKLTQTVYLDRVLKIAGVAGFVITYLNAWRSMGLGLKAGFVCSAGVVRRRAIYENLPLNGNVCDVLPNGHCASATLTSRFRGRKSFTRVARSIGCSAALPAPE